MVLENVLREIRNFFVKTLERRPTVIATNKITFNPSQKYVVGQYIYITGSILNDGVHKITLVESDGVTVDSLEDEEAILTIYGLAIPKTVIAIADEIALNGQTAGVNSESLGDYSVSYGEGNSSWQNVYKDQLDQYRRVYLNLGCGYYDTKCY